MVSKLIIVPAEKLQSMIIKQMTNQKQNYGLYVSLNKPHQKVCELLKKEKINLEKIFFIDCVSSEDHDSDIISIHPRETENLSLAINHFIKKLPDKKYLLIDSLSTLMIYNDENKVAKFVKEITESANNKEVEIIALSPKTKGEELLNKIFNFFDQVKK